MKTWSKTCTPKKYPALTEDINADVCIIGSGITGITLAYLLGKSGRKVVVVEKDELAESMSAYSTAFITYQIDTRLQDLKKMFGNLSSKMIWESHQEALKIIARIISDESIDCEFTYCPLYVYANNREEYPSIEKEALVAQSLGFKVEIKEDIALPFHNDGYYVMPNHAKFNPLKYMDVLRQRAEQKYNVRFYEKSPAEEFEGENPYVVKTPHGSVIADFVVIATHNPFNKPKELFGKKGTYLTYLYELSIPSGMLPEAIYVAGDNPYHYFRVDKGYDRDRIIIGGEDHRREIPMNEDKVFKSLLEYAEKIVGKNYTDIDRWKGKIIETWDGLAFIGEYSHQHPNVFLATGYSGNGITYGTIASQILHDQIMGIHNPYSKIYDPHRGYSFKALEVKGSDYIEEFFNGALKNIFKYAKARWRTRKK